MTIATRRDNQKAWQFAWDNRHLVKYCYKIFDNISAYDRDMAFDAGLDALYSVYLNRDPAKSKNGAFSRYATMAVKRNMRLAVDRDQMVHVPEWTRRLAIKVHQGEMDIEDVPEANEEAKDARQRVKDALLTIDKKRQSIDHRRGFEIVAEEDDAPQERTPPALSEAMAEAVHSLPEFQWRIIVSRYGITGGGGGATAEQVAEQLGVELWRVKKTEKAALSRLRTHLKGKGYESN